MHCLSSEKGHWKWNRLNGKRKNEDLPRANCGLFWPAVFWVLHICSVKGFVMRHFEPTLCLFRKRDSLGSTILSLLVFPPTTRHFALVEALLTCTCLLSWARACGRRAVLAGSTPINQTFSPLASWSYRQDCCNLRMNAIAMTARGFIGRHCSTIYTASSRTIQKIWQG